MKQAIAISFLALVLLIAPFVIYRYLPIEITRKSDIDFGNKLIANIEIYKKANNRLPGEEDWETLKKIGFEMNLLGTRPSYESDKQGNYELGYLEGFDGPYLIWRSKDKEWKMGFPEIYTSD